MTITTATVPWFADPANLVLLTRHLADEGCDGRYVADAVEKPWHFEPEFRAAWAIAAHEANGHVVHHDGMGTYFCGDPHCYWSIDHPEMHVADCDALKSGTDPSSGDYSQGDLPCSCGTDAAVAS